MIFRNVCATLALLPIGACGTLDRFRSDPAPVIQPLVLPAECGLLPVDPDRPDPSTVNLPPLPAQPAPTAAASLQTPYYVIRTQRAEIAGRFFELDRNAALEAWETNATPQRVCAEWVISQRAVGRVQ